MRYSRLSRWLVGALFVTIVAVNAVGFGVSEVLRRLGPPPLGETITWSPRVVDRDGKLLRPFTTASGLWRLPVTPAEVDKRFLTMLVAYEDKRFYEHSGVDFRSMARATWQMARNGRVISGGSTLTMQVARLLEPRPDRTYSAKIIEMIRAWQIERRLSKAEILTLYLEMAPYGGNIEGTRAASLAYFGKEPTRLSAAQAALLVALPQSPEVRRPDRRPDTARAARNRVLQRMAEAGVIGVDQARTAATEASPKGRLAFPMLAAHLSARLASAPGAGVVERTTLSLGLQQRLESLARERAGTIGKGTSIAIIAVDNESGEVLAHVGGVDFFDTGRAGQMDLARALRSPGSTLKPFIYGLALEDGLVHPATLIDDRPTQFDLYKPENFDESFQGTITIRRALQQSLNVPAVALLNSVGPNRLIARLGNAGVSLVLPRDAVPGLAVGLGGAGVRLTDLATLYLALARQGEAIPLVWRAQDRAVGAMPRRFFTAAAAWQVGDILRGAPPPENARHGEIAYKTGTSYGYRDAWAIGFDGANTVAVWVGRPDGSPVPGMAGRNTAAPILFDAFERISPRRKPLPRAPDGVRLARTAELPPALQRFRPGGLPLAANAGPGDAPLVISFPPDGSRLDLAASGDDTVVALKAMGGAPPFTWLVDGVPVVVGEERREAVWDSPHRGFARLSVIDARGQTAASTIRLE